MTPEGRCPVCKLWCFVDGVGIDGVTTTAPRIREHSDRDPGVVRRAKEKAIREGRRGYRLPSCRGSDQGPLEMRWPNGEPYYGASAEVRLQWPTGAVYWEGPMGALQ